MLISPLLRSAGTKAALGLLFGISLQRPAQAQVVESGSLRSTAKDYSRWSRTDKPWALQAGWESLVYVTEVPEQEGLNQQRAIINSSGERPDRILGGRWDFEIAAGRGGAESYVAIHEAALERTWRDGRLALGRLQHDWNLADTSWGLGLWQPVQQLDALRVRTQGVVGVLGQLDFGPEWTGTFLASPVFLPSMNPDLRENQGGIQSLSRWGRSFPTELVVLGRPTRLVYRLSVPGVEEIVSKPALLAQLRWRRGAFSSQLALARKPVNMLSFKYDAAMLAREVEQSPGNVAEIEVLPVVHMHTVAGWDLQWKQSGWSAGASLTADIPEEAPLLPRRNREGFEAADIQQDLQPAQVFAAYGDLETRGPWTRKPLHLRVDYLRAVAGPSVERDQAGREQSRLLPSRFPFQHAVAVSGATPWTDRLFSRWRLLRELEQRGTLASLGMVYQPERSWEITVGLDFLGVDDPENPADPTGFLNKYRQNDRVTGGLSYVF